MAKYDEPPRLGKIQERVLDALKRHDQWPGRGGGWVWENRATTIRTLDSLVTRGLVSKDEQGVYRPTKEADRY
jgi:DNA-binding IclR family transcriptional regulator